MRQNKAVYLITSQWLKSTFLEGGCLSRM